jgi:ABC-type Fe3+/spermidine/putrescine transport system ATPase subunit
VLQSGSCREVYQRPASVTVGRLLGIDNLFEGGVPAGLATGLPPGARLLWQVPPEALRVREGPSAPGAGGPAVDLGQGRVTDVVDLGRTVEVVVKLSSGIELRARTLDVPGITVGTACRVETDPEAVSVWPELAACRRTAGVGAGVADGLCGPSYQPGSHPPGGGRGP